MCLTVIKSEPHKSSSLKGQSVGHRQAPSSHRAPCSHFISRQRSKRRETPYNKMHGRYILRLTSGTNYIKLYI